MARGNHQVKEKGKRRFVKGVPYRT